MFRSHCQHLPPSEICLIVSWTKCLMYFTIFRPYLPQKRFVSWAKETNFLVGSWMCIVDQLHPITKYVSWSHELMSHGTLSCDVLVLNCTYCYYLQKCATTLPHLKFQIWVSKWKWKFEIGNWDLKFRNLKIRDLKI